MKLQTIAGFAKTNTAAQISAATTVSYNGRKDMQRHYDVGQKPVANMNLKNN